MGLFTGREVMNPKPRSRTLMDAVRDDDRGLIMETLQNGESVTQKNAYQRTPLHKAAYYSGDPGVISELIKQGADVNAVDKGNWCALHFLVRNAHNESLKLLLDDEKTGTKIVLTTADNKHGWTPAHSAAIAGNAEAIVLLKQAGADLHVKDKSGASVFDLMKENGIEL
jgi:ankyrin repeat protein|tara:strand:+ start:9527 stop:10033 length:507 start_codon:yes stop_codon:yes gene_type:complete|mmetsp:Transcript_6965/g.26325  ORF Transcript_6965/g.26325 Transcript_6965/m.26325 type:complete len:169 (+) Transcript_6965:302-808(+)